MLRVLVLAAAFGALTPGLASAQIYAWRDGSGNLVMSDKPKNPDAKSYAISSSTAQFRTTNPIVSTRAAQYDSLIEEHANRHSLSPDFVRAVIQAESAFNPRARSPKGAMGLMQLMPETAANYGVVNAYDPAENIRAGVAYLKSLLIRFDHDESLALAAYNAGPGAVEKYGRTVPPYPETRNYVARIRNTAPSNSRSITGVYKTVEVVDGHKVVRYTNKASKGSTSVAPATLK
jgi:soluble lytic murein transglycosylase-like protein